MRPALAEHPFEVRTDDAVVTLFERGVQFEDRFARAIDQSARLAMRDRHVAADEIHRQLDDHPNTAESSALEERGADFRHRFGLKFRHRAVRPANADL